MKSCFGTKSAGNGNVTTLRVVWIEINYMRFRNTQYNVTTLRVVWIEISAMGFRIGVC